MRERYLKIPNSYNLSVPWFHQSVHTCSCATELCNKNWAEAGSTEQPDGPTDAPTEPAVKTVKVGKEDLITEN